MWLIEEAWTHLPRIFRIPQTSRLLPTARPEFCKFISLSSHSSRLIIATLWSPARSKWPTGDHRESFNMPNFSLSISKISDLPVCYAGPRTQQLHLDQSNSKETDSFDQIITLVFTISSNASYIHYTLCYLVGLFSSVLERIHGCGRTVVANRRIRSL
jgi:hypothetical protein